MVIIPYFLNLVISLLTSSHESSSILTIICSDVPKTPTTFRKSCEGRAFEVRPEVPLLSVDLHALGGQQIAVSSFWPRRFRV